jgi:UDP-N-acetylmuramate dehydrogenase
MIQVREQVSLAGLCRFHVGGPADYFVQISGQAELEEALAYAREHCLPYFAYAGGTNLFFDDAGFRGLVIRLKGGSWELAPSGDRVIASAGYKLGALVRELAVKNTGGLEFMGNIPGSVGGALVGNAGCYGQEIADVLREATVFDTESRELNTVEPAFFEFAYRHSKLKLTARYIALTATLATVPRPGAKVLAELEAELDERQAKHPHEAFCAGSFFKNPSGEFPAWRVITDAGLKQARVGDAALSERHANFLVNNGNATSADILALMHMIQAGVQQRLGIELVPEVRYISPGGTAEPR